MKVWPRGGLMSLQRSKKRVPSHGAEKSEKTWQVKWRNAIDVKHANRKGIIAEEQRAGFVRRPPFAFLAVRNLPVRDVQTDVGIEKPRLIARRDGARGKDGIS